MTIKKTAVLGAGVMGAQIAGHLAGCGVEVLLMDLDQLALKGIEHLKKARPPAMYDLSDLKLITTGNLETDLEKISDCDWIVEVIIEQLDIKQQLFSRLEKYLNPKTIISSNTSGILLRQLVEGRSDQFRKNFLITHFFNPVRYMKLVELVHGKDTDPNIVKEMADFLELSLGKGVVYAKDTPNFIANRIGVHAVITAFHAAAEKGWPIEVIDQVMGPPTARPKSAIFRTADIVGLDTLVHVAKNSCLNIPSFVEEMVKKGWIGEKAGQGFYKKTPAGILVLDIEKMEYRPQQKLKTPSLGAVREIVDPAERLKIVVNADDEAGKIASYIVGASIDYASAVLAEIADSPTEVDRAMRWGFGWELGPFEQLQALGYEEFAKKLSKPLKKFQPFQSFKKKQKIVSSNAGADVVDLGDGIYLCEFHTKMNAIDGDVLLMLDNAVNLVEKDGVGLVIGNYRSNFSAGANLMLIWMAATNGQWDQIADMVDKFHGVGQKIRFCKKPVVAAPFGLALGGGCEISMAAGGGICAAAETYMGLVEAGVGVIPAGGGCKNLLLRMEELHKASFNQKNSIWYASKDGGPFPKVREAFTTIAFAKISSSAKEAKKIGYMRPGDKIVLDREKLIQEAKNDVVKLSANYTPPVYQDNIVLPGMGGEMALVNSIQQAILKGDITEHDGIIAGKLARVLSGGDNPTLCYSNEQHILDLEKEAFLSLCGMEKTQNRMQYMLTTGKPLRN